MLTHLNGYCVAVVTEKWDVRPPEKPGDKVWYTIKVGCIGDEFRLNVSEEQYNAVNEGDTVKIQGQIFAVDGQVKFKRPQLEAADAPARRRAA